MPEAPQPPPPKEITSPTGESFTFAALSTEKPKDTSITGIAEAGLERNGFPDEAVDALANIPNESKDIQARMDDKDVPDQKSGDPIKTKESNEAVLPVDKAQLEGKLRSDPRFQQISQELSLLGSNGDEAVFDQMRTRYTDVADMYTSVEEGMNKSDEAKEQIMNEKRADRIQFHANSEVTKLVNKKFEETHGEFAKTADGVPLDSAQVADYVRMRTEVVANMSNSDKLEIRQKAMTATLVDEYTERNPRPNQNEDPKGFDEWAKGLREELDQFDQGQKASSESKQDEDADPAAAKEQEDETNETSWGNARKLAQEAIKGSGEDEDVSKRKIDDINSRNPQLKPSFKTRVRLMKISLIGESMLLMATVGALGSATTKIEQGVKS